MFFMHCYTYLISPFISLLGWISRAIGVIKRKEGVEVDLAVNTGQGKEYLLDQMEKTLLAGMNEVQEVLTHLGFAFEDGISHE